MPDTLIKDAQAFLRQLAQNNEKAWWEDHKDDFAAKLKAPALALLDDLAPALAELSGDPVKPKLFRQHRDVRFSKDKTPYKTHLHMMWTVRTGGRAEPAYFFGIDPGGAVAAAGMMGLDKDVLSDWRKMVDLDAERIGGIVAGLKAHGFDHWHEPELKRVPKPWDADHPLEELLRRKSMVMSKPITPDKPLSDALLDAFAQATPLNRLMGGIAFG